MIGRISGHILEKQPPLILVDVQGVGYEIQASMATFYQLPEINQAVILHTHLIVREDAHILFGFSTTGERIFFRQLIKINGVGPKLALAILSGISSQEFVEAVQNDDVTRLVRLPGIGKKTAERLIIEMRDKITQWSSESMDDLQATKNNNDGVSYITSNPVQEAISALVSLGYKQIEANKMVAKINSKDQTSEDLIKQALKNSLG